jgi:hypothetical protein
MNIIGKRIKFSNFKDKAIADLGEFLQTPQLEGYSIVFKGYIDDIDIIVDHQCCIVGILDKELKEEFYPLYIKRKLTNNHYKSVNIINFPQKR